MAKRKTSTGRATPLLPGYKPPSRRRRTLILPTLLRDEADNKQYQGSDQQAACETMQKWAELETKGHLAEAKETAINADFLHEVFGSALHYRLRTDSPECYNLEREFSIPGAGTPDGALGVFRPGAEQKVVAVIELKAPGTDLDRDRFNGRTPVQQCWDYLNALPECPWGIVSDFLTIRLYHRNATPMAYEEFSLQEMRDINRFRAFYCLFEYGGLLRSPLGQPPRAERLLKGTGERQRQVGDELYEKYNENRISLIDHLQRQGKTVEESISVAQKILDRIVFVAFCEDRGLLPARTIEKAYQDILPFAKVTNPRWRNFLDLFHAVDKGHRGLGIDRGYNGGLFRQDPQVDDLQLGDEWTDFFHEIGRYDFRDEVNVDVLGHLFEKSVTEIEKLRQGGLFEATGDAAGTLSKMPKSAKRKRLGIYYTPPEFTEHIIRATVGELLTERLRKVSAEHGIDMEAAATVSAKKLRELWLACIDEFRTVKVCDPACGSGAFLIQAYEVFEEYYHEALNGLRSIDEAKAEELDSQISGFILADNLYGVDLSVEAVEITQLALWIRSARRGKTLADLSRNIVVGNSLVEDPEVDGHALDWQAVFPDVFSREPAGFDCVFGNPPWERLKLQEREFFSFSAPHIAEAVSAATRREHIEQLQTRNPRLFQRYQQAKTDAERVSAFVRASGRFPLTARGDINTYMLFAELAATIVRPTGWTGLLVPSGIATDDTTKVFFQMLMERQALARLYDFENRRGLFPDVHRSFKFSILVFGGAERRIEKADFVFFAHHIRELEEGSRHIALGARDIALMNPNTRTCPIFRSNRDAEITRKIYRQVPVLVDESRGEEGNPWGVRFVRMFDQTNDAELFHTAEQLTELKCKRAGHRWMRGKQVFLPLYEAKMIQAYDHRAAGVLVDTTNWVRQAQPEPTSLVSHQNPDFFPEPRWWVDEARVAEALRGRTGPAYLAFKDVTSPTNERTMIAAFVPQAGVVNSAPLILMSEDIAPRLRCCLLANLNSFVYDYVARQKVGNIHLNFYIVEQLPTLAPVSYRERCFGHRRQTLEKWISDRVLRLTCTSEDMRPLAEACGFGAGVHRWNPRERVSLTAELDAAFFHLYGLDRQEVEYALSTFPCAARLHTAEHGAFRLNELILDQFDRLGAGSDS